ncbi:hypothetical protein AX14_009163 [Amanita brunnescens Koide BX004]|nr:hypothetical protein AX14_009163 [Amanita brunnescens Koide BX004]
MFSVVLLPGEVDFDDEGSITHYPTLLGSPIVFFLGLVMNQLKAMTTYPCQNQPDEPPPGQAVPPPFPQQPTMSVPLPPPVLGTASIAPAFTFWSTGFSGAMPLPPPPPLGVALLVFLMPFQLFSNSYPGPPPP